MKFIYPFLSALFACLCFCFPSLMSAKEGNAQNVFAKRLTSPNHKISVLYDNKAFSLCYKKNKAIELSFNNFDGLFETAQFVFLRKLNENYRMKTGKRAVCMNEANEYKAQISDNVAVILRIYNDGIAFRYEYNHLNNAMAPFEQTAFKIMEGTKRWMQQWTDSYEGFFPISDTYKQAPVPSFSGSSKSKEGWNNRWGFPALIQTDENVFALITEANIERHQSAACLFNEGEIFRVVPDKNEKAGNGPWHSPWRVVIVGTLADVVESTLVTDVSEPAKNQNTDWIQPGVVSWVYWAYNHGSNDINIIKRYVDMAEKLKLPYVLIDAEWDQMKDGFTVEDAVRYAKEKGVKPMIWYNSSVGWVDGAPTPKYKLNKPEDREKEFAWCEKIGVAGVKIDFFSGDNQMNMDYCIDLMEDAAKHHLLVNFHGATVPRGWQRTYPNLMSTEGVYGAEWYNNVQTFTNKAAAHNATLPFTRNVIGPMDYTPCAFSDSQHPHITSKAHELALTVLFESSLQHLADRPESFYQQPDDVQQFLGYLPAAWDDTKLINGYPGQFATIARKSVDKWFVAGINGTDSPMDIKLDLKKIVKGKKTVKMFLDNQDNNGQWVIKTVALKELPSAMSCVPRGGFLLVIS